MRPPVNHFYRARLVKAGPWVGVATFYGGPFLDGETVDRSPRWQALVDIETDARAILQGDHYPIEVDGLTLRNLREVSAEEYLFHVKHSQWARKFAPSNPSADPRKAIDITTLAPIW